MSNLEFRVYEGAEIRADAIDPESRAIEGLTAVFDSLSVDLGGFRETIAPGAFASALERSDPLALFNHDSNMVLGRYSSGTLELEETDEGLWFRVNDMPASREDVLEAIRRGDVRGNSFAFTVGRDSWRTDDDGTELRTIEEVDRIFDVGPVVYPAYPDTVVSTRALEDLGRRLARRADVDPAILAAHRKRLLDLARMR